MVLGKEIDLENCEIVLAGLQEIVRASLGSVSLRVQLETQK